MSGLIQKDISSIASEIRYFLFIILAAFFLRNSFLYFFAVIYASVFPSTALAYDERSKWNRLADMLPFTPKQLVGSKYILGYSLIGATAALFAFSGLLFPVSESGLPAFFLNLIIAAFASSVSLSVQLPFMFWIGVEKSRFFIILIAVGISGTAFPIADKIKVPDFMQAAPDFLTVFLIAAAAVLAINLISFQLSRTLYSCRKTF